MPSGELCTPLVPSAPNKGGKNSSVCASRMRKKRECLPVIEKDSLTAPQRSPEGGTGGSKGLAPACRLRAYVASGGEEGEGEKAAFPSAAFDRAGGKRKRWSRRARHPHPLSKRRGKGGGEASRAAVCNLTRLRSLPLIRGRGKDSLSFAIGFYCYSKLFAWKRKEGEKKRDQHPLHHSLSFKASGAEGKKKMQPILTAAHCSCFITAQEEEKGRRREKTTCF